MAVDISNGGLNFGSSLDPTGFLRGAKIIEQSNAKLITALETVTKRSEEMGRTMAKSAREAANGFSSLEKTIIGTFTAASIGSFISKVISVRGEFQQLNSAFKTMLGSKEKADALMAEATQLAATTPFSLQDVASGAKQLLAYGFAAEDITKQLTNLGNIASGVGAPLNDIVYLYGTLKASGRVTQMDINQFAGRGIPIYEELAKVMGVTTDAVRGLVSSGKVGFPQIEKAFDNMTGSGGKFFNLMQEQSKSLTGQISNLGDAFDRMLNEIGQSNEGFLSEGIQAAISLVENYKDVLDILGVLIATYGAYKAAVIVATFAQTAQAAGFTILEAAEYRLLLAQEALNASMLANPYVLAATALAALVAAIVIFSDKTDNAAASLQNLNSVRENASKATIEQKQKLQDLIKVANNETLSLQERETALKKINQISPEFLGSLTLAKLRTEEGRKAIEEYNRSIDLMALKQASFDKRVELQKQKADLLSGKAEDKLGFVDRVKANFRTGKSGGFNNAEYEKTRQKQAANFDKQLKDIDAYENREIAKYNAKKPKEVKNKIIRTVEIIDGEIKGLKERQEKSSTRKEYEIYQAEIKKLEAEKRSITGETDKAMAKSAKLQENFADKRADVLKKISDTEKAAFAASLGQNEREIAENKAKYEALLGDILEYNAKAKKAGAKQIGAPEIEKVKNLANTEEATIRYKQETAQQAIEFEKQKKLFADYEDFKTSFGEASAKKRFGYEVKTNADLLLSLKKQAAVFASRAATTGLSAVEMARFEQLGKQIEEVDKLEQQRFSNALQAAQTYTQKATQIEVEFQQQKRDLFAATNGTATKEQYKTLEEQKNVRLRALNEENAYAQSGYADLMENMLGMTKAAVLQRLAIIKQGYENNSTLTPNQKQTLIAGVDEQISKLDGSQNDPFAKAIKSVKEYKKAVKDSATETVDTSEKSKAMFGAIGGAIDGAGQIFGSVTGALQGLGIGTDKYTQATLKSVEGLLGGMGELAKGIASGNPVDIIKGSINILTNALDLFNTKDKKLERQIDGYKANLAALQKSYADLDKAVKNSVGESIYADQSAQIENLKRQQQELTKARDAESQKKKKDQGKIDEYNSQISAIPDKIDEINKAINQGLIQTTFKDLSNSLADAFTEAFKAGENGIEKMDDVFNNFIGNAIKNSLKLRLIEPIVSGLTADLTEYAKKNGNSIIGFDFSSYKNALGKAQKEFEAVLGSNKEFFESTTENSKTPNSLKGAYSTASQESISLLAGQTSAMRLAQLQTNALLLPIGKGILELQKQILDSFAEQVKIEANTRRTADNTERLQGIETALVSMEKKMSNGSNALTANGR